MSYRIQADPSTLCEDSHSQGGEIEMVTYQRHSYLTLHGNVEHWERPFAATQRTVAYRSLAYRESAEEHATAVEYVGGWEDNLALLLLIQCVKLYLYVLDIYIGVSHWHHVEHVLIEQVQNG